MLLRSEISMVEETGPESSEDYYHELDTKCSEDLSWSQSEEHQPDYLPRCQHCRHWIGQSDLAQQMQHVLNGCKTFLQQGRYDWRHDSVLNYIASCMRLAEMEGLRWHCDLPGYRTHDGGTVPDQLVQTDLRPDICILDQRKDRPSVILLEVTITWDCRLDAARQEKNVKYSELMTKISRTCPAQFLSLEIGSYRQKLSDSSRWSLKMLHNFTAQVVPFEVFEENILRITEICSYKIFAERFNPTWDLNTPYPMAHLEPTSRSVSPTTTTTTILPPDLNDTTDHHMKSIRDNVDDADRRTNFLPDLTKDINETEIASGDSPSGSPPPYPEFLPPPPPQSSRAEITEPRRRVILDPLPIQTETLKPFKSDSPTKKPTPTRPRSSGSGSPGSGSTGSLSMVDIISVLIILLMLMTFLYFMWNNLAIFMPIFIVIFLILKYFGKA